MTQSRTHTCNQLRIENVGEKVKIVGWMENVREVGQNFAFVIVRDYAHDAGRHRDRGYDEGHKGHK